MKFIPLRSQATTDGVEYLVNANEILYFYPNTRSDTKWTVVVTKAKNGMWFFEGTPGQLEIMLRRS